METKSDEKENILVALLCCCCHRINRCAKTFKSNAEESNDLLMANVEAMSSCVK